MGNGSSYDATSAIYRNICLAISEVVEAKRRKLTNHDVLTSEDVDDLRQDACVRAGKRKFSQLATQEDYLNAAGMLVNQALTDWKRQQLAAKRDARRRVSLDALDDTCLSPALLEESVTEAREAADLNDLCIDVASVRSQLHERDSLTADMASTQSFSSAAQSIGVPRETFRDRVKRLDRPFRPLLQYVDKSKKD